jgi:hypothetical protein
MNALFILLDNGGCWIPLLTFIIYSQLDVESTSLSDASYDNSKQIGTYKNTSTRVLSIFIYVCPYNFNQDNIRICQWTSSSMYFVITKLQIMFKSKG